MKEERLREALEKLLSMFESGNLPPAVARTMIRRQAGDERPSDKWSLGNRLLMYLAGTEDARGYRQWEEVGRHVKKGAKAFHILAPLTKTRKVKIQDPETGEEREEERPVIVGFRFIPVFRLEDTEGEPLPEVDYAPPELPPLFDVATRMGIKVKYAPGDGSCYGSFQPGLKRINLHTHDVKTYFHELAHAVHNTIRPLVGGQDPVQEVVAETVACTLCEIYGYTGYAWHGWQYIKACAGGEPKQALKLVMKVLCEVEEVLERIWEAANPEERGCAA
ncbi:ArdC family protein [Desulfofundulus thermocisternus]|jgi:hypothetical protein|nr:ArdC family protein [Desulfofundulus thermocisternus]